MDQTASVLFSHFTSAALVVWIIQRLKAASWFPLVDETSQVWVKRLFSVVGALGAHTGINLAWHAGGPVGGYQVIATIPPLTLVLTALWRWAGQYVLQEGWYQVIYNRLAAPGAPPPIPAPQKPA